MTTLSGPESVIMIDCRYVVPEHAAAYLVIEGDRAAFVDNTAHAVPLLIDALDAHGLRPEQVDYVVISHLHLDHAGGTSALVERCLNATVIAHPRAVRHLADPSRLVASVKSVYGEEEFDLRYGAIDPIEPERIRAVEDDERLEFGGREFRFLHTRGHANHHICIYDSGSNGVFTGDSFGVAFNAKRGGARPFLLCSSAPTDFDPDEARVSVEKILATGAERAYLPHFGELDDIEAGAQSILESIGHMEAILNDAVASARTGKDLDDFCETGIRRAVEHHARACGVVLGEDDWAFLESDLGVNAQGLAMAAEKRRR